MIFVKITILSSLIILCNNISQAQKSIKTSGEAHIKIENTWTYNGAKDRVRELAKINAIENVFGTYVEQESNIKVQDGNTNFRLIASTKVKGEWLETSKEEFSDIVVEPTIKNGASERWINCKIKGLIREIVKPKLAFEVETLNGPKKEYRTTTYQNGEQLFLSFKTPSAGFLTVYIVESEKVYRLLPYAEMDDNYIEAVPVIADKEYVFFSQAESHNYFAGFPVNRVDELIMSTYSDREYSQLYVVFSTESFSKPLLKKGETIENLILPKSLSKNQFEKWVKENRIYNSDFNYQIVNLEIIKK